MYAAAPLSLNVGALPAESYVTARHLIASHGQAARQHAVRRLWAMRDTNDRDGERTWMQVFAAVLDMQPAH